MQTGRSGRDAVSGHSVGQRQELGAAYKGFREKIELPGEIIPPYASFWLSLFVMCANCALWRAR